VQDAIVGCEVKEWTNIERKASNKAVAEPLNGLFEAIATVRNRGVFVAADVGSAIGVCYPPYNGADAAIALGASIGVASGAARAGDPSVALTGDFAFIHSGVPAAIEIAVNRLNVVVVVLANGVQQKTGGQPLPEIDLARLAEACGLRHIERWSLARFGKAACLGRLEALVRQSGPAVVVAEYT
jgi:indolepyruvate ferredoxin oxidoreductase alpha subunit